MSNIAICDDEQLYLDKIAKTIRKFFSTNNIEHVVKLFDGVDKNLIMNVLSEFDIIILDIDMPNITGIEVADQIRKYNEDVIIVFCTNVESLVFQTIKYAPFRFIRKSKLNEEMLELLESLKNKLAKESVF